MDRVRLFPMELPRAVNISGNNNVRGRLSFVKRLALCCIVLAGLGLLYVPAYHSAREPIELGDTASIGSSGITRYVESFEQLEGWSFNTSRNLHSYISSNNNTTILSPDELCASSPYLVIIICSAIGNHNSRNAIRNTWGSDEYLNKFNLTVKIAFLLGQNDNDTLNNAVVDENDEYGDIIQATFHDTYNNLTLKSVMMLKWVTKYCSHATYLMKTDDDMYINVDNLLLSLSSRTSNNGVLLGSLICNAHPISDPKNKWYTPKYMFSEKTYPNYLSGTGYVMSLDVADKLYKSALSTPLLHLEDVYITGLCAKKSNIRPINHPGFSYVQRKFDTCVLRNTITNHRVNSSMMYAIWNKIRDTKISCPKLDDKKKQVLNRQRRNIGYYMSNRRTITNRCA
ncbi:hypothetical protein HCN44_011272 [Aphidius gifuensis]|uniref:Hexosyltransferase n=1 Tax=Aphidius gifuensis TaxID=684658 RepID=A0A834XV20_APHGI|nr:beta-1,3-galactosyltransferase 1-like [Aphidius gifuensis]XP_044006490.1 beta-1,3-galactosyltransferase 1-like [Aphidius gifuensis]KAF7994003.1 hypothetical protein HCN44_011272 [Aphidius gifuensis]